MEAMDRREFFRSVVGGAAVATVAVAGGAILLADIVEAAPLVIDKNLPLLSDDFVRDAQVVIVKPGHRGRGRRRVRRCWWQRGRRVCGWRWI